MQHELGFQPCDWFWDLVVQEAGWVVQEVGLGAD